MEVLSLLEKRIASLLELTKKLQIENNTVKAENSKLVEDNLQLAQQVEHLTNKMKSIEGAVVENSKDLDELSQEKALTKMVVDDLIKSIDSFVKKENTP